MADVTYIPENQGNNVLPWMLASQNGGFGGMNNVWPWLLLGSGGFGGFGGFGGAGLGGGILGFLLGALINNNGLGGLFGGNGAGLGAQINSDNNTGTVLRAIDGTDADVRLLATTLNADVNEVRSGLSTVNNGLTTLAGQFGISREQVLNQILSGNASLASQLCQCCCENKLLVTSQGYENQLRTLQQTNELDRAIGINGQRTVDAIADLKATMIDQFCGLERRDMQNELDRRAEIITQLRNEADNARQTAAIGSMLAPIASEVDSIKCKMPQTVAVTWPNLAAVNTTPYVSGGYYQGGFNGYYGGGVPGFGGNGFVF